MTSLYEHNPSSTGGWRTEAHDFITYDTGPEPDAPAFTPPARPSAMPSPDGWKDTKDGNPKQAFADTKAPISAVPGPVMYELGLALLEGALKYGRHNWRVSGVRASTYFDAALRHLWSWWEGEDIDPDSGLSHIVKAMACLAVVRDAQYKGKYNDDRPPKSNPDWMGIVNAASRLLREKYPSPKPPHTEIDTKGRTE